MFCAFVLIFCTATSMAIARPIRWNAEIAEFDQFLKSSRNTEPEEDFDETVDDDSQNAWEQSGKFEGDIILSENQRRALLEQVSQPGLSRNGLNDVSKRWPKQTLVYTIADDFTSDQESAIKDAMAELERASCIKFKEKEEDDLDYVEIQGNRRGCFSQVGYQGRGKQIVNLTPHRTGLGCMRHGTIVHELLHSLGFFHMQSDTNRDEYVDIVWDNILNGKESNFKKYNSFVITDFGVPYDYDSVLHYSEYAFSKNGRKTIVPKKNEFARIGQRGGLSDKDSLKLNRMYKCGESQSYSNDVDSDDGEPHRKYDFEHSFLRSNDDFFPRGFYEFDNWWGP